RSFTRARNAAGKRTSNSTLAEVARSDGTRAAPGSNPGAPSPTLSSITRASAESSRHCSEQSERERSGTSARARPSASTVTLPDHRRRGQIAQQPRHLRDHLAALGAHLGGAGLEEECILELDAQAALVADGAHPVAQAAAGDDVVDAAAQALERRRPLRAGE